MDYSERQRKVLAELTRRGLDALLVTHTPNIRYLSGFTGSSGALAVAAGHRPRLFIDGRYLEQARQEVVGCALTLAKGALASAAAAWLAQAGGARLLGFESQQLTVAARSAIGRRLPARTRLRATDSLVEQLRMVKQPEEIERIRAAVRLASGILPDALQVIRPGISESAVAAEIEYRARRAGAEAMSFPTLVSSGARSAMPHAVASSCLLPRRGFVILDFGVILGGYCSDMTRTVYLGRVPARARSLYQCVREAQQAAKEALRPGIQAAEVDAAARRLLRRHGFARYFSHSTGHGLGLEIHESPRLGRGQRQALRPGMVVTVEPGVYIPGEGGVRIEDVAVVTDTGCEVLTPTTHELIVIR